MLDEAARAGLRVMVGMPWSQHVAFLDDERTTRGVRRDVDGGRQAAARPPGAADGRARQRDPGAGGALARAGAHRALPARAVRRGQGGCARHAVHLRELPADRIPRAAVPRRLRVQRLPARRDEAAPLPGAAAARGRQPAAAAGRGGRRQHSRRAATARPTSRRCSSARHLPKARAAPSRSRGPTSGGAAASRSTTGRSASSTTSAAPSRPPTRWHRSSPTRRSPPAEQRTWPKVSVVVCAYNAADTLEDCLASLGALTYPDYEVVLVNDGSKDDTEAIAQRHPHVRLITTRQQRPERRPQRRPVRRAGTIVAYTDADVRVDPRLAHLSRAAVPALGRRRRRRTQRGARRRSVGGAVRGPRARRPHARALRRSHRRTRARLQHGDAPRRAARHRRLQPDLPARRRRRRRLLAAAGARLARSASRRRRSSGITTARRSAPTGASRSATARARCGSSRTTPTSSSARASSGAATSTARCRSSASLFDDARQRRSRGARRRSRRCIAPTRLPIFFAPHTLTWQVGVVLLLLAGPAAVVTGPGRASGWRLRRPGLLGARRHDVPAACAMRSPPTSARCRRCPGRSAAQSRLLTTALIAWLHFLQPLARARGRAARRAHLAGVRAGARPPTPPPAWHQVADVLSFFAAPRPGAHASGPSRGWRARTC